MNQFVELSGQLVNVGCIERIVENRRWDGTAGMDSVPTNPRSWSVMTTSRNFYNLYEDEYAALLSELKRLELKR